MPLPPGVPDLLSLDLLVTIAEVGSLAKAGEMHNFSQPAASMRINTLERRLGIALLERSPAGSKLTPAGEAVVEWVQPLLDTTRALIAGVEALRVEQAGHLRVAASLTVAEYLMPRWLVGLRARSPQVSVALEVCNSREVIGRVSDGVVEVGFVEGLRIPKGLHSRIVGEDELVVVVPPSHPWSRRRSALSARELAATPLVSRERGSGTREVLDAWLSGAEARTEPALQLGSTSAVKAAVLAGEGPAVLSRLTVASEIAAGRLIVVPVADLDQKRLLRAVWLGANVPRGPARALVALASSVDRASRGEP